jgi:hypothetical protein
MRARTRAPPGFPCRLPLVAELREQASLHKQASLDWLEREATMASGHLEFTDEELRRWLLLRAIEWANWPAFISQAAAPVLFLFFSWPYVLAGVIALDLLWVFVRYSYVSPRLANIACLVVVWLKWPAAVGSAIYLLHHQSYAAGVLALIWPLLAGLICVPAKLGRVELLLAKAVGYVEQDTEMP